MATSRSQLDQLSDVGSLCDDDSAFPGLDVYYYCAHGAAAARRDWERDATFERAVHPELLTGNI